MKKDQLLWWLGALALGFTYIAAVNVTVRDYSGRPVCGGMWNPMKWFEYCDSALPPRLGVMTLGAAVFIVCGYFAQKSALAASAPSARSAAPKAYGFSNGGTHATAMPPAPATSDEPLHWTPQFPSGTYKCQECGFETLDGDAAVYHMVMQSGSPSEDVKAPPPHSSTPAAEYKPCPDCAEQVRAAARKCRFCGCMFE